MTGMTRFTGKTVLITGGGNGIGRACAERFAAEGAAVISVDLDTEGNRLTESACRELGAETEIFAEDVTDPEAAERVVMASVSKFGTIDVLVCSAGIYSGAPFEEVSFGQWKKVIDVNLTGTFLFNRAVSPVMKEKRSGSIINISSMAGKTSWPASFEYSASKSGVIGLTRSAAMELAPYGVTVNALCPGNTLTDMVKNVAGMVGGRDGQTAEEWLAMRAGDCPMQRLAEPWEMAGITAFLASDDSRYITGQSISADGGMVLS